MEVKKMKITQLEGLDSKEYEHPFDKKALDVLEGTPGFEALVKKFGELELERLFKIQFTGSNMRVNTNNFPELYSILEEACNILYVPKKPDLYLSWSYNVSAMTTGVENPIVILDSGCIDLLDKEELLFIIGHELGHIKSNHVLYQLMAEVLPRLGNLVALASLDLGSLITTEIELALLNWKRMSEFTADRAGLLTCQNPHIATKTLIKMAGMPRKYYDKISVKEFITQAKEFESFDFDSLDKTAKYLSVMGQDHPWTVMRGTEVFKWIKSGEYNKILNRELELSEAVNNNITEAHYCTQCGNKTQKGGNFCSNCGSKISAEINLLGVK